MSGNYNDRDYERIARRRRTQRKSTTSTIIAVVVIAAAIIAIAVVIIAVINGNKAPEQAPASVEQATEQPTLYIPGNQTEPQPATAAPAAPTQNSYQQPSYYTAPTDAPDNGEATEAPDDGNDTVEPGSGSAEAQGGVLHVYTTGFVTGDYFWTYDIDNVNVTIKCSYDYSSGQYDFSITGVSPGVANIILYYKTDDTNKASYPLTVSVADDLSVAQIG